jgi:hypothetical protein
MDRILAVADQTIRRACGFAGLAVVLTMLALSFDRLLAFRVGALMTSCVALVLAWQAWRAPATDVRRTELWSVVGRGLDLPRDRVQALLSGVLRDRYLWHATVAAAVAVGFWAIAGLLALRRAL